MAVRANEDGDDLFEIEETGERSMSPNGTPDIPSIPIGDIVTKIADRVTKQITAEVTSQILGGGGGSGGNEGGPPPKTFLGSNAKNWLGSFVKSAGAVALAVAAWVAFVNDSIEARPTYEEAEDIASDILVDHEAHGEHPTTSKRLDDHEDQMRIFSDIQIRQTTLLEGQAVDIEANETKFERHRNRDH